MKLRILLFEDDDGIREMLQKTLQHLDCEVHGYAHPGLCPLVADEPCPCEAQRLCADAILSDLNMPVMSGLDLVARLQKRGCHVPRHLLVSGNWTEDEEAQARQMGCEVIEKPFNMPALVDWVAQCRQTTDPGRILMDWRWDSRANPQRKP